MLESIREGGAVRVNGRLLREPLFARSRLVPFHDQLRLAASIPWGDVSTAYHSTGIPNIVVYRPLKQVTLLRALLPLVSWPPLNALVRRVVEHRQSASVRPGSSQLWGRASSATDAVEGTLTTPQAYELTARTAVECAERVAAGQVQAGAYTPSQAFGADFITTFEGCELRISSST
jgi:saccharopine dehydrogenase (NAD+, L-lysine-forming)